MNYQFFDWSWEVVSRNGKWYCEQHSNEAMRIGSDGSLHFGKPEPMRAYEFLTKQWAQACRTRMEIMDRAFYGNPFVIRNGLNVGIGTNELSFQEMRLGARTVITFKDNQVIHIDLPYFVWTWLKGSAVGRGLKRLWYGERGRV